MSGKPKKRLRKRKAQSRQAVAAGTHRRRKHDRRTLAMATVDNWRHLKHFSTQEENLRMALEVAVPFRIEEVRRWPWDVVKQRAEECGELICYCGDALMFGTASTKKKGEKGYRARDVFNALVDALAIGALQPGGIYFGILHFEAQP
jgi:hypothetical protein